MSVGVYKITNKTNDKFYIGSSTNIGFRWNAHLHLLRNKKHGNRKLQNSFNKHGECSFYIEILEICKEDVLISREQYYMDTINPSYNIQKIAGKPPSPKGIKRSLATREKHRMAQLGKKIPYAPRPSNSGENHKNFGKPLPEEIKKKISKANKGKTRSDEFRKKMSEIAMSRGPVTEETRLKISESSKGRKQSFETIKKRTEKNKKKVSGKDINTGEIFVFNSIKEAGSFAGTKPSNISNALIRKQKSSAGYSWNYLKEEVSLKCQ